MSNVAKVLSSAGNTQGIPDNSENLFSTFVYPGSSSGQTINNGINLSGEGGLVWTKDRTSGSAQHALFDTERGVLKGLSSSSTSAEADEANSVTAFNSNGYTIGTWSGVNYSNINYVSWTFRKAPKFFDIVTYTGTGPASGANEQAVSHNLGVKPALVIIKKKSGTGDWWVFTDVIDGTNDYAYLNNTNAFGNSSNNVPTDSVFNVGGVLNADGATYVAYLFASNDGAGTFGPNGNQDIIKVGKYAGGGSSSPNMEVNVGFEPQWVLIKNAGNTSNWAIFDMMRVWRGPVGLDSNALYPNLADPESGIARIYPTPTGFKFETEQGGTVNSSYNYVYMAIARPMSVPTAATDVFSIDTEDSTEPRFDSNHIVDLGITRITNTGAGGNGYAYTRFLDERVLYTSSSAQKQAASEAGFDFMSGHVDSQFAGSTATSYMWKRAPKFFDIVTYTGTSSAGTNVTHNLGVAPEMMWIKKINGSNNWKTFHSSLGPTKSMELNTTVEGETNGSSLWSSTAPTSSVFTLGSAGDVNSSSHFYIAYLFATLAGISKVGSYTGNGGTQNIECGFSSGARFVLIKRTDTAEGWKVHDTTNGIVAGNDPFIELNNTNAQNASFDLVDPYDGGFTVNNYAGWNGSGGSYIFYAVA